MVLCKLTGKMFHKSLTLVVRNLSLILRLNISPNSKYLILPVLNYNYKVPYNSDLSTNFLKFYAFDMQIATFSFFTILSDSVFLLPLKVTNLISSSFPLIRFAHLFLVLNSSLTLPFLKMENPNHIHSRGKQTLSTISSTHCKTISYHATGQK